MEREITKEMMKTARSYIPLDEKTRFVGDCAPRCFDRLQVRIGEEPAPPLYMVSCALKSRYLMAALAKLYFGASFAHDDPDENLMTVAEYDAWAGGHVLNQIERWKSDRELRDKCFDLLADFHDLEKRLNAEIQGLLTAQNDPVTRQSAMTQADIERLPALLEEFKRLQGERTARTLPTAAPEDDAAGREAGGT